MTQIEIVNPVPVDEVGPWLTAIATTFLEDPQGSDREARHEAVRRDWEPERTWGARADSRWIATLATLPRTLTVPGTAGTTRDVAVDAVTAVSVSSTHRRRGVLTRMLSESLQQARDRNDTLSVLIAAEWPIYGRFGYAPATLAADYAYFPRVAAVPPADFDTVRQVDPHVLADVAPPLFDRARRLRAGQMDRPGSWWARRLGVDGYRPVHQGKSPSYFINEGPDGIDGLLWWTPRREFEMVGERGAIVVGDLVAANLRAYRNLWTYLSGIDLIGEINLARRPVDEPIRWLLPDGRALRQTYSGDNLWLRILDVPAALAARGYATGGHLVLEIIDGDVGSFAAGRYLLETDGADSACRATQQSPDLTLSQRSLASLYLGGASLRQLAITGDVVEHTASSIERADMMFATALAPWNATMF